MIGAIEIETGPGGAFPPHRAPSLRRRVDSVIAGILLLAIAVLTAASALVSRGEVLRGERLHAAALLDHLTGMPLRSEREMAAEIAKLSSYLTSVQAALTIVAEGAPGAEGLVIDRPFTSIGGRRLLRYTITEERVSRLTRSIVLMHVGAGTIALILMLGAVEWTLRRRLVVPLQLFRSRLDALAAGGWSTALPEVDAELAELRVSLGTVGPALTAKTLEWFRQQQHRESAAALTRIRNIIEERVPLVVERIERLTRSSRLSVLSLNEAYAAEEEMLAICAALEELQAVIDSPAPQREGHA
jgi:hypothetical protein